LQEISMAQQNPSRQQTADRSQSVTGSAQQHSGSTAHGASQGSQSGTSVTDTQSGARQRAAQSRYGMPARSGAGGYGMSPLSGSAGPLALMRRIGDEMDDLLERFGLPRNLFPDLMGQRGGTAQGTAPIWSPRIDVTERNGRLVIQADLPGVRREDVDVQIQRDAVIIQGERKEQSERRDDGYVLSERFYGSFYRAIPLPEGADVSQANATFRDGVLEIEVPLPRDRSRRLELRDSSGATSTGGSASGGTSGTNASGSGARPGGSSAPSDSGGASSTSGSSTGTTP
jgi:HSP20 family protein